MNCYMCELDGKENAAVGLCRHCGAALCARHLKEAQAYAIGGMAAYGCPHQVTVIERPSATAPLTPRPAPLN